MHIEYYLYYWSMIQMKINRKGIHPYNE